MFFMKVNSTFSNQPYSQLLWIDETIGLAWNVHFCSNWINSSCWWIRFLFWKRREVFSSHFFLILDLQSLRSQCHLIKSKTDFVFYLWNYIFIFLWCIIFLFLMKKMWFSFNFKHNVEFFISIGKIIRLISIKGSPFLQ